MVRDSGRRLCPGDHHHRHHRSGRLHKVRARARGASSEEHAGGASEVNVAFLQIFFGGCLEKGPEHQQ